MASPEFIPDPNAEKTGLVLTLVGPDRPGLVDTLATLIAAHGGNWLESRMCRLGGQFAGILRADLPSTNLAPLVEALHALAKDGLKIQSSLEPPSSHASPPPHLVELEIMGQDRPGIVREISHALAAHGVNVEELHTETASAPMTGEQLFTANATLHIPPSCDIRALRASLEKIANDLMVDLLFGRPTR